MTSVEPLRAQLVDCAAVLGVPLESGQVDALLAYLELLQRWNAVYNLTAVRDLESMLTQHVADCLAVVPPLVRQLRSPAVRLLDVGSGGGLPSVVVAIALPSWRVVSVDAVGKKAAFVRQVAAELRLAHLTAEHGRVEALALPSFDAVVSRAFASLVDFVRLSDRLLAPHGVWMAMKGKVRADEISALPPSVEVFHVEHLAVPALNAERSLVWMRRHIETESDPTL